MRSLKSILATSVLALALLAPTFAMGASVKTYQVTGKVLGFDDKIITVEKGDEKWEIERTAATTITGTLKVGEKVTISYKMVAADVEVKKAK